MPLTVVVSHAQRQHSYQTALAAQEAGALLKYITGIYYLPGRWPYSAISLLPDGVAARLERQLQKRRSLSLDSDRVLSLPQYEMLSRVALALPGAGRRLARTCESQLYRRFDPAVARWKARHGAPAVFHGFEGCSLRSLQEAQRQGAKTLLDLTSSDVTHLILAEEHERLGIPYTNRPDVDRVFAEEDLADYVLVPATHVAESAMSHGIPAEKLLLIPYGIDIERFHPGPSGAADDGRFRALFVGQIGMRKGAHYLLQAWQELKLPRAELLVIGSPIDDFGRRLMDRYAGTCRWLPNVPNDEIHSHFQRSHVFVLPSLAEGSALVSYEAMASGLPVITTANAGAIARDGIEGFILPLRDVKGIQEKLVLLYQDAELRQRMGAAARRRAEQFTWGHYRARLGAAYRALAAGQPPQQAVATVGATVECVP